MSLLSVRNLKKSFKDGSVLAVRDVSFDLERNSALGVVGESGSGKSTLAKLVMQLVRADSGHILFDGKAIDRRKTQIVFQNPYSSFDPRMKMGASLAEAYRLKGLKNKGEVRAASEKLLLSVQLPPEFLDRYPHELSGGECQRLAIARAISVEPDFLVCDEPVSSLDLLAQA